jgi:lipopolysaccharide transport system permease protein
MQHQTTIEAKPGLSLHARELWQFRELFYFFTWRDLKVRYKQTFLGIAWVVLQPVALMALFTYLFTKKFGAEDSPVRYEIFVLSGLVIWTFFQSSILAASESIVKQAHMINKIYFPRIILPVSALLVSFVDFAVTMVVFLLACILLQQPVSWNAILYFPLAIAYVLFASFGLCSLMSALIVKYRDLKYVLGFTLQFLFFASNVLYSVGTIEPSWLKYLLSLNPANGAIELMRMPLTGSLDIEVLAISFTSAIVLTLSGIYYFRKTEAYFADIV